MKEIPLNVKRAFVPFFIMSVAAVVTIVCYICITDKHMVADYLAVCGVTLVPLLFPVYTALFKRDFPLVIYILVCVHLATAANLGTAFKFYDLLPWWDLLAHGLFGFNCCLVTFYVVRDYDAVRSPWVALFFAVAVAMALAGVWEIIEYITDRIAGGDVQRVAESIAAGKSPLADTMEDIMITFAGGVLFAVLFLADKLADGKIFAKIKLSPERPDADTDAGNRE